MELLDTNYDNDMKNKTINNKNKWNYPDETSECMIDDFVLKENLLYKQFSGAFSLDLGSGK